MLIQEKIINQTSGNLYWKDARGNYLGCNENMANLFKLKCPDEIIGKNDYDFFLDDHHVKKIIENDRLVILSGKEIEFEEIGSDETGKLLTYKTRKVPLKDDNNNIIGIMGTSLDITKEKEAEITRANFISNMQHDLRTPFAGISAIAGLLRDMEDNPEKQSLLDDLLTSCGQWEQTHHEIIAVLSDQKPYAIAKETFSISQEIRKIGDSLAATLRIKETNLVIDNISDAIDSIETDRLKFSLILSNIIGNAVKFTNKGSIKIKVAKKDSTYSIAVIDTGVGIPEDKLDSIFEQFIKLSNSNKHNHYQGVGLGLYMARQIATLLGGVITVTSTINEGSTFTLTLPT